MVLLACAGCKQTFKRLATHLSQSPGCTFVYTPSHEPKRELQQCNVARLATSVAALPCAHADDEVSSDSNDFGIHNEVSSDDEQVSSDDEEDSNDEEVASDDDEQSLEDDKISSNDEEIAVEDVVSIDDDDEVIVDVEDEISSSDDDVEAPGGDDEEADSESNAETGEPNTSVLELYHLLKKLRSNPLELERFSKEELVYISLLQLLNEIKAPLNAFARILTCCRLEGKG